MIQLDEIVNEKLEIDVYYNKSIENFQIRDHSSVLLQYHLHLM